MINRTVVMFALLLIEACDMEGHSSDNIAQLKKHKLVSDGNYEVVADYFVGGWDFFDSMGLLAVRNRQHTVCQKEYFAAVSISENVLNATFQKNAAPTLQITENRHIRDVLGNAAFHICESIIYSKDGEWFGVLELNAEYLYFESRNTPHDPAAGFRYIDILPISR